MEKNKKKNSDFQLFFEKKCSFENKIRDLQSQLVSIEKNQKISEIILAAVSEAIFFIDLKGKVHLFNDAALQLFGLEKTQIIGCNIDAIFEDDFFGFSLAGLLDQANRAKKQKKAVVLCFFHKRKKIIVEVSAISLPHEGVLCRLQDRTKMRQLESSSAHNETLREVGVMAARLAHEIRNPLTAIMGFSHLLKDELKTEENKKLADAIIEATGVLNKLVEQVLSFSKPLRMDMQHLSIATLFTKAIQLLPPQQSKKVEMITGKKTKILADEGAMVRLILNLLKNGFEAGSDKVFLREDLKGFSVVDFGKGLTKEEQKKIFSPFYTTKISGSGLGLAEVDNIIKSHGFSIVCKSAKKKTTFQVIGGKDGNRKNIGR